MKRTSRPARRTSRRAIRNPKLVGNSGPGTPTFLEEVTSIGDLLHSPGAYYTTTGQQAYGVVKALEWHPMMEPGEETFFVEGSVFHFEIRREPRETLASNPATVSWGTTSDYYSRRIESYDKWELAWWREVAQNSRDARATRFDWTCEPGKFTDPDTNETTDAMTVIARDNGTGMDEATLRAAFFTRGGSVKEAGAVGGFGDAKELILTPWLGYEVRTRDLKARGRHEDLFAPGIESGFSPIQGTEVKVWMPMNRTTSPEFAMSILERSYLPGITTTVNGKRVDAELRGGTLVHSGPIKLNDGKDVGTIEIYHQARAKRHGVYIRGNGVFMFEESSTDSSEEGFKGVVYVDIKAPPRSVFTKKRDALSWESSARNTVKEFVRKLSVDPRSTLKAQRAQELCYRKVIEGTGPITTREGIAAEVAAATMSKLDVKEMEPKKTGKSFSMSDKAIDIAVQMVSEVKERGSFDSDVGSGAAEVDLTPHVEAVRAVLGGVELLKTEQVAGAIRMAAWKPDFLIEQTLPGYKMPKKLDPTTMQPKYLRLIRLWSELCKYALIQLGMFKPFGVGWVFDTETDPEGREMVMKAGALKHNGITWLLLNPIKLKAQGEYRYEEEGDTYDLGSERDLEDLCASVIHEVTHMQGYGLHDQAYAYALTENIRIAFGMKAAAKKILKAVNVQAREEGAARKAGEAEKVNVPWDVMVGKIAYALYSWDGMSWAGLRDVATEKVQPDEIRQTITNYYTTPESVLTDMRNAPPKRASFELKPKSVPKLYEELAKAQALGDVSDEQAREMAKLAWQEIPADPRAKVEAPSDIGVYTWVKGSKKDGETEYVLRVGYAGQRGAEAFRFAFDDTGSGRSGNGYYIARRLEDKTPEAIGAYERANNIHRRYTDNLVWYPFGSELILDSNTWRVEPSYDEDQYRRGHYGRLQVKISKDEEGGVYVQTQEGGPPSKRLPSFAEGQKYTVEWAIKHRATVGY